MRRSQKVWVIDVDDLRNRVRGGNKGNASGQGQDRLRLHVEPEPNRTGRLFLGAYALGPLAPVLMRQGRGSLVWAAVGLLGIPLWGMTLWRWSDVSFRLENGQIPFSLWLLGLGFGFLLTSLAWARSLWLAGSDSRFFADRVPRWLGTALPAGLLGLTLPGSGLLLVGAPRRAAAALLGFASLLLSLAILWKSQWMWQLNGELVAGAIEPRNLEKLFLAAAVLAFLGGMVWVASILDGMRCGLRFQGGPRSGLGDWMTFFLLIAVLATYFGSEPKSVARDVHDYAAALQAEGMQVVPLQLARLAKRLDPARPRYAMHLAALLEENGDRANAEILRGQIRTNWQEYERLQMPAAPDTDDALQAAPTPLATPLLFLPIPTPLDSLATPATEDSLVGWTADGESLPTQDGEPSAIPDSLP